MSATPLGVVSLTLCSLPFYFVVVSDALFFAFFFVVVVVPLLQLFVVLCFTYKKGNRRWRLTSLGGLPTVVGRCGTLKGRIKP